MNSYVDNHLQQRKLSLTSLSKNRRQPNRILTSSKDFHNNKLLKQPSNQNIMLQKTSLKESNSYQVQNKQTKQERDSSLKNNSSRLRDDQSSDYIRNLYKKYLGKQNKEPCEKINAFTQRKLRTSESRELISTNTTGKDFTKRILFTDQQMQVEKPSLMKKQKGKLCQQIQSQNQMEKLANLNSSKAHFQSSKRESVKKSQKQCYQKQSESKKNPMKSDKTKSKVEKSTTQEESKTIYLKRSQSTQLKSERNQNIKISSKKTIKQQAVCESSDKVSYQRLKQKDISLNNGVVHPHRQSYCQFDTEQEIQKRNMVNHYHINLNNNINIKKQFERHSITQKDQCNYCKKPQKIMNPSINEVVYLRYMNDLPTLQMLVGKQNSLFQTLKKINNVKINKIKRTNQIQNIPKLINQKKLELENKLNNRHIS